MINHPTSAAGFFLRTAVIILFTFLFFRLAVLYRDRNENEVPAGKAVSTEPKKVATGLRVLNATMSVASASSTFSRVLNSDRSVLKAVWGKRNATMPKTSMSWDDFIKLPAKTTIDTAVKSGGSILLSLKMCPNDEILLKGGNFICKNVWNSQFLLKWHSREVKALCDDNANSKVRCFDSPSPKNRFCVIENAMLDFRRMRRRKSESGQTSRSFEKGFLSADCNTFGEDSAVEDIGHLPIYSPSIQRGACDYVFETPVLLYSHENIRNSYTMLTDTLNVFTTLLLHAAVSKKKKGNDDNKAELAGGDVMLLNLDGLKKNPLFNDQLNQFFTPHLLLLKNIIKAQDLIPISNNPSLSPRLCFKQLLLPPRPLLPLTRHEYAHILLSANVSSTGKNARVVRSSSSGKEAEEGEEYCRSHLPPSPIYQQLNLHLRHALKEGAEKPRDDIKILLLLRRHNASSLPRSSPQYYQQRTIGNEVEVVQALRNLVSAHAPLVRLVVQDAQLLSYEDLLSEVRSTSLLIALHSASMVAATLYLPIGTKHCCAVLELSPLVPSLSKTYRGYGHLARHLGVLYDQMDVPIVDSSESSAMGFISDSEVVSGDLGGGGKRAAGKAARSRLPARLRQSNATGNSTLVPVDVLVAKTQKLLSQLLEDKDTSCLLPEVAKSSAFW